MRVVLWSGAFRFISQWTAGAGSEDHPLLIPFPFLPLPGSKSIYSRPAPVTGPRGPKNRKHPSSWWVWKGTIVTLTLSIRNCCIRGCCIFIRFFEPITRTRCFRIQLATIHQQQDFTFCFGPAINIANRNCIPPHIFSVKSNSTPRISPLSGVATILRWRT